MMGLSCIFEGYGKFCSGKNITKCSLFEVENPCLSSFLGKFLHSLKRANPTTTAAFGFLVPYYPTHNEAKI